MNFSMFHDIFYLLPRMSPCYAESTFGLFGVLINVMNPHRSRAVNLSAVMNFLIMMSWEYIKSWKWSEIYIIRHNRGRYGVKWPVFLMFGPQTWSPAEVKKVIEWGSFTKEIAWGKFIIIKLQEVCNLSDEDTSHTSCNFIIIIFGPSYFHLWFHISPMVESVELAELVES